ncbi:MAG: acyl carrier protein [Paludibacterium sp.]|uniref:phosphopantetheine-binding protein n=1 Tax=Paludibacterium sp. TaxID=1917523 RepID=UPI0025D3C09A|nr:phosphopantetheine-binding protein [Paludibacterium sp.]MBV8045739.1 acyl carrier protein [Paludibacterium sp.]MBV8649756.1 acyl carrier protein [Paludibacterium sp.]
MELHSTAQTTPDLALEKEMAALIVTALNLDIAPEAIVPEEPLYGDKLGIDSIDILEIALVVSKQYGVQMKADSEDNAHIFGSLRALTAYVGERRVK